MTPNQRKARNTLERAYLADLLRRTLRARGIRRSMAKNPNATLDMLIAEWEAGRVQLFISDVKMTPGIVLVEVQAVAPESHLRERLASIARLL